MSSGLGPALQRLFNPGRATVVDDAPIADRYRIDGPSRKGPPDTQEITTQGISFSRSVQAGLMTREDAVAVYRERIAAQCGRSEAWQTRTPEQTVAYYASDKASAYDSLHAYSQGKLPAELAQARFQNASMVERALAHLFYGVGHSESPPQQNSIAAEAADAVLTAMRNDEPSLVPQSASGAARASASGGARPANLRTGPLAFASGSGVASPARTHLTWCVERAAPHGEAGDLNGAIRSFLQDTTKHAGTEHIGNDPLMNRALLEDARDWPSLKQAMLDYNV